ncbi:putative low complexity protein [Cryptosporidium felis]|nr:putative low complexity protein [Cryptosporidium felis]
MNFWSTRNYFGGNENCTAAFLLESLLEMMKISFQYSEKIIENTMKRQMIALRKYRLAFGPMLVSQEVQVNEARKILQVKCPKYKTEAFSIKAKELRDRLEESNRIDWTEEFFPDVVCFDGYFEPNSSSQDLAEQTNEEEWELFLNLPSFEEYRGYEEKYLCYNDVYDYYGDCGAELKFHLKPPAELQNYMNLSTPTSTHSRNSEILEDSSSSRLVNRSITRKGSSGKSGLSSTNESHEDVSLFHAPKYCYTSSFFTVKSSE